MKKIERKKKNEFILMKINDELKEQFQSLCYERDTSMSEVLTKFIKTYVEIKR